MNIDQVFLPLKLVMQLSNKYHACIIVATRAWWKPYNVHMVDDFSTILIINCLSEVLQKCVNMTTFKSSGC